MKNNIAVVAIGRNEGDRLRRCLESVQKKTKSIVYVDSGSTDGSIEFAKSIGVDVCKLDMSVPFSAARARNAGFSQIMEKKKNISYVQFIDGDCILEDNWLEDAASFLEENEEYAIAAGRRKEMYPERTIYNLLCDIEWNTPVGDAEACGGDFLIRTDVFISVEGFNPTVIAGEEPDLCHRIRKKDWKIRRLDAPMTRHDAAMTSFRQWWKRAVRAGHSFIHGYSLHKNDGTEYNKPFIVKDWLWGGVFPLSVVLLSLLATPAFLSFFAVYLLRFLRISWKKNSDLSDMSASLKYGFFIILSSFPQLIGQLIFLSRRMAGKEMQIIEHK